MRACLGSLDRRHSEVSPLGESGGGRGRGRRTHGPPTQGPGDRHQAAQRTRTSSAAVARGSRYPEVANRFGKRNAPIGLGISAAGATLPVLPSAQSTWDSSEEFTHHTNDRTTSKVVLASRGS